MSLINEDIKQMKMLINYKPKLTLTENISILSEGLFDKALKGMSSELRVAFKTELSSLESVKNLVGNEKSFKNIDDLFDALQAGRISGNNILKDILKNPSKFANKFPEVYKSATTNYAHQLMNSKTEIAKEFQNATPAERKVLLHQAGYSKQSVEKITQEVKSIEKAKLKSKIEAKKGVSQSKETETLSKETGKTSNEIDDVIKTDTYFTKNKKHFTDLFNRLKYKGISNETRLKWIKNGFLTKNGKIPWKSVVRWAAAIGISYLILKAWFNKSEIPVDETDKGGDTTTKKSFKQCNSFPYTEWCVSNVVAEVQKCLGLNNDGQFGPKTKEALINAGYGVKISKDDYNKIKQKCNTNNTDNTNNNDNTQIIVNDPNQQQPQQPSLTPSQEYGIEPTPQSVEGGIQYIEKSIDDY